MEIRNCQRCGSLFKAKKSQIDAGCGHYCSHRCSYEAKGWIHLSSPENLAKATEARRKSIAIHGTKHKRGPEHPAWKGGKEAYQERRRLADPAKRNATRRAYLRANPEKAREWSSKRRGAMTQRLPRGTVKRIGELQRWRCAACAADVRSGFHLDHVIALAAGGEHAPHNLQLLCKSCKLRKSAKHPVDFMQQMGKLL